MHYNSGTMRKAEVKSLLEVRDYLECLCVRLVIKKASDEALECLGSILDELRDAPDYDAAADCVFRFYHELAIMSGNVLLPLMYYSFKAPGEHLWGLYCKRSGIKSMYELKLKLYRDLLNRDEDASVEDTHMIMADAIENLNIYGS